MHLCTKLIQNNLRRQCVLRENDYTLHRIFLIKPVKLTILGGNLCQYLLTMPDFLVNTSICIQPAELLHASTPG